MYETIYAYYHHVCGPCRCCGPLGERHRSCSPAAEGNTTVAFTSYGVFARDHNTFGEVAQKTKEALVETNDPDAVELMGYSKRYGTDANGNKGEGEVLEGGPAQRQAPAETKEAQQAAKNAGYTINPSYDAGRYLCNAALYTNLGFLEEGRVEHAGFVHVPARAKGAAQNAKNGEAVAGFVKNLVG
ncbi:hypothetical protein V5S96_09520 [Corynebacterium mastitidis]|uniref:Pyrrolidone-carboxylate peptidase n=1 Tax=Corynebacterium mastitidis TaxID=161890 RepID=A0ABU8NZY7_9CORY